MQKMRYDAHQIRAKIHGTWSTTIHHDCFMMNKFARAPIPCRMHRTSRVMPAVQSSCKGISATTTKSNLSLLQVDKVPPHNNGPHSLECVSQKTFSTRVQ